MKFTPELLRGTIKSVLLAVIARGDIHGYEMLQVIKERSDGALEFSEGSLYPALHALEADRCIRSYWALAENGRERKYYSLTVKGGKVLRKATKEWRQYRVAVDSLLKGVRIS